MLGGESAPQPWRLEPDERGEDRAAGPAGARGPGPGRARRRTATSCRSTSSSASLEADERPGMTRPKFPPSRLADAFDQVVEPLITEIT